VTVRTEAVCKPEVGFQVDDLLVVCEVTHTRAPGGDGLNGQQRVLLRPLLLVVLDERQMPLTLFQKLRSRCVVGILHHLGDDSDFQLGVVVRAQVEEVLPLRRRDDDGVPHERLEQTVRQALRRPQRTLQLVNRVLGVVDSSDDVKNEFFEVVVFFENPLVPMTLNVVR